MKETSEQVKYLKQNTDLNTDTCISGYNNLGHSEFLVIMNIFLCLLSINFYGNFIAQHNDQKKTQHFHALILYSKQTCIFNNFDIH